MGQVEKQERWVKWEATTAAGLTCQSEPEKIDITISSTPAPIVKKIEICEEVFKGGSIPTDKEPGGNAEVNDNDKKLPDYEKYVIYECWTIRKAERRRIDAFKLWCWKDSWTARRSNQSILKKSVLNIYWKG